MTSPSQLGLARAGDGAGDVCPFALQADMKAISETSEVEMVDLSLMPSVCDPCFAIIQ